MRRGRRGWRGRPIRSADSALPGQPEFEGYRQYANWREGIADWYRLIDEVYIRDRGETTIDAIVIWCPVFDQNDPAAYIRTVKRLVARWGIDESRS
ncbi:MAG: hypothetical protein U0232_11635 [Thermomicrobiales bacterium]